MVNKFKTATKRIAAVAASAAIVSSTAFAGGLSNYPNNFVKDGKFVGQVVVGATADAMDTTSAQSIIDDLAAQFSGNSDMVKITATKTTGDGEKVSIADSGKTLNYGEDFTDVRTSAFDDSDLKILNDGTFNNGVDDQDYTQEIKLASNQGYFEHDLRDDFETTASDKIYLDNSNVATYTLEFKTPVHYDPTSLDKDFVGKTIDIMGQEFTITKVGSDFSSLELIGGSNKVTLGEGDSTTVTVDGKEYNINVQSVSSGSSVDQVLVTVNGNSQSIDEYDTENVDGVTIGVTDAFPSSRDSVKGYATLIVGGNKVKLDGSGGEVKINDKTISDVYDNYVVTSTITANASTHKLEKIVLNYKLDDDMILKAGESWTDKVFNAFGLTFEGTNNVTYSTTRISESNDRLNLEGKTVDGKDYNEDIAKINDDTNANSYIHLIGDNDDDSFVVSNLLAGDSKSITVGTPYAFNVEGLLVNVTATSSTATTLTVNGGSPVTISDGGNTSIGNWNIAVAYNNATSATVTINGVALADANGFETLVGDKDNQELYKFKTYTVSSNELDVEDILTGDTKDNIAEKDIGTGKLTDLVSNDVKEDGVFAPINGTVSELALENNGLLDLSAVNGIAGTSKLTFSLDGPDLNADDEGATANVHSKSDFGNGFNVTLSVDTTDNEFNVKLDKADDDFVNQYYPSGAKADVTDENSDVQEYVTSYGTKVTVDNQDNKYVDIAVPDKQVEANVYLTAGAPASEVKTYTVEASAADAKVAELKAEGYSVSTENVAAEQVEFDISGVVHDVDVTDVKDAIVVGGPAVNSAARTLLGIDTYTIDQAGVKPGEAVAKYFADSNSLLVYGYSKDDTAAIVEKLNAGTANIQ